MNTNLHNNAKTVIKNLSIDDWNNILQFSDSETLDKVYMVDRKLNQIVKAILLSKKLFIESLLEKIENDVEVIITEKKREKIKRDISKSDNQIVSGNSTKNELTNYENEILTYEWFENYKKHVKKIGLEFTNGFTKTNRRLECFKNDMLKKLAPSNFGFTAYKIIKTINEKSAPQIYFSKDTLQNHEIYLAHFYSDTTNYTISGREFNDNDNDNVEFKKRWFELHKFFELNNPKYLDNKEETKKVLFKLLNQAEQFVLRDIIKTKEIVKVISYFHFGFSKIEEFNLYINDNFISSFNQLITHLSSNDKVDEIIALYQFFRENRHIMTNRLHWNCSMIDNRLSELASEFSRKGKQGIAIKLLKEVEDSSILFHKIPRFKEKMNLNEIIEVIELLDFKNDKFYLKNWYFNHVEFILECVFSLVDAMSVEEKEDLLIKKSSQVGEILTTLTYFYKKRIMKKDLTNDTIFYIDNKKIITAINVLIENSLINKQNIDSAYNLLYLMVLNAHTEARAHFFPNNKLIGEKEVKFILHILENLMVNHGLSSDLADQIIKILKDLLSENNNLEREIDIEDNIPSDNEEDSELENLRKESTNNVSSKLIFFENINNREKDSELNSTSINSSNSVSDRIDFFENINNKKDLDSKTKLSTKNSKNSVKDKIKFFENINKN